MRMAFGNALVRRQEAPRHGCEWKIQSFQLRPEPIQRAILMPGLLMRQYQCGAQPQHAGLITPGFQPCLLLRLIERKLAQDARTGRDGFARLRSRQCWRSDPSSADG